MVEIIKQVRIYRNYKEFFDETEITLLNAELLKMGGNVRISKVINELDGETLSFEIIDT